MTVTKTGEVFENTAQGFVVVGDTGLGQLRVTDGAVFAPDADSGPYFGIGQNVGGDGLVSVVGAGSLVDLQGAGIPENPLGVQVGRRGGEGRLEVAAGGRLVMQDTGPQLVYFRIGSDTGSVGAVTLSDGGVLDIASGQAVALDISRDGGDGTMTLSSGAELLLAGHGTEANTTVRLGRGDGAGGEGRLDISSGARMAAQDANNAWLLVGVNGSVGMATLDAGRLELTGGNGAGLRVGEGFVGFDGPGTGTVTLRNGAEVALSAPTFSELRVGGGAGADGLVEVLSGSVIGLGGASGYLAVGQAQGPAGGDGRLVIAGAGSRVEEVANAFIGRNGGVGRMEVLDGGALAIGASGNDTWADLGVGRGGNSDGTLIVDRGLITVQGANGRNPDGDSWQPYTVIGRDGGAGRMELTGDLVSDPGALHGVVQIGGGESAFALLDIGRGDGAVGEVTVTGALLATINRGSIPALGTGEEVDLPGEGGGAPIRIGVQGGEGSLTATAGAEVRAHSGVAAPASFTVGENAGSVGVAVFDDSSLLVRSDGSAVGIRTGYEGDGQMTVRNGSQIRLEADSDSQAGFVQTLVGTLGGNGSLVLTGADTRLDGSGGGGGNFAVGESGAEGRLTVTDRAAVTMETVGFHVLDIGRGGGDGTFELSNGATFLLRTTGPEDVDNAYMVVGSEGGIGTAVIDDARLDIATASIWAGIRVGARFRSTEDTSGTGDLTLRNGAHVTLEADRWTDFWIGGGSGGHGTVTMLSGAVVDMGGTGLLMVGRGREERPGDGSGRLVLSGEETRLIGVDFVDVGRFGAIGTLEVAAGAFVGIGGLLRGGDAGGPGTASLVLDGGTIEAGEIRLDGGVLAGSGLLRDSGAIPGFLDLRGTDLRVGDRSDGDGGLQGGIGTLTIAGDLVQTGGRAAFDIGATGGDQLLVAGTLTFEGTAIALDWAGPGSPGSTEVLLAAADGGISLLDTQLEVAGFSVADLDLRAGDTELWAVLSAEPGIARTGSVVGRDGAALDGVVMSLAVEGRRP